MLLFYFLFCFYFYEKGRKSCSQEFVCVENFLSFFFRLCPRLVCFSQKTFGSHRSLFCESRGEIASLSRVKHSSWLKESKRLMQASTLCSCQAANHSFFPCSLSQCILKAISVNTLSTLRSHLTWWLDFSHFHCVMYVLQHCR